MYFDLFGIREECRIHTLVKELVLTEVSEDSVYEIHEFYTNDFYSKLLGEYCVDGTYIGPLLIEEAFTDDTAMLRYLEVVRNLVPCKSEMSKILTKA